MKYPPFLPSESGGEANIKLYRPGNNDFIYDLGYTFKLFPSTSTSHPLPFTNPSLYDNKPSLLSILITPPHPFTFLTIFSLPRDILANIISHAPPFLFFLFSSLTYKYL